MKIEIDIPEKVALHIDDVVAHVRAQNPEHGEVTIEEILSQECVKLVAGIYNAYLTAPEPKPELEPPTE